MNLKHRIVQKDGKFYPEYKFLFFWMNYCTAAAYYDVVLYSPIVFDTIEDARQFFSARKVNIEIVQQ